MPHSPLYAIPGAPPASGVTLVGFESEPARSVLASPLLTGDSLRNLMHQTARELMSSIELDTRTCLFAVPRRGGDAYCPWLFDDGFVVVDRIASLAAPVTLVSAQPRGSWSTLVVGDTIATGTTMSHVLDAIHGSARDLRQVVVHGFMASPGIERVAAWWQASNYATSQTAVTIYPYEAVFALPDSSQVDVEERIGHQDFLRGHGWESDAYRALLDHAIALSVEKCAVYDMGDRLYEAEIHYKTYADYWSFLAQASNQEAVRTLRDARARAAEPPPKPPSSS